MPRKSYTMKMVEDKRPGPLRGILKVVIIGIIILVVIAALT